MASCVELKQNVVEKEEIILEFDGEDHMDKNLSQFNIRDEDVFTLIRDTIKSLRNNLTWVKKLQYSEMFKETTIVVERTFPGQIVGTSRNKQLVDCIRIVIRKHTVVTAFPVKGETYCVKPDWPPHKF